MRVYALILLTLGAVTCYSSNELSAIIQSSVKDALTNGNPYANQAFIQQASIVIQRLIANPKKGKREGKSREESRDEKFLKTHLWFSSDRIFTSIASALEDVALIESSDITFKKILNVLTNCHAFVKDKEDLNGIIKSIRHFWFELRHGERIQEFRDKGDWLSFGAVAPFLARDAKDMGYSESEIGIFYKSIFNDEGVYQVLKNINNPNAVNYMKNWKQVHHYSNEIDFRRNAARAKIRGVVNDAFKGTLELPVSIYYDGIKYTLSEHLGSGRDGAAYKATVKDGDDVVVKIVKDQLAEEDSFEKEIDGLKITERLIHVDTENRILIFKLIPGITFAKYLAELAKKYNSDSGVSDSEFQELVQKVRDYFSVMKQFSEKYGLIHGDVRPLNTIITPDGTMELIDLGSCERVSSVNPADISQRFQLECDMSKLELYYWVSRSLLSSKEPSMQEEFRHLLIVKATPGRESEANEYCNSLVIKHSLSPDICQNVESDNVRLREKMKELVNQETPSVEEINTLGTALRERFMFIEDGQLKSKLSSFK